MAKKKKKDKKNDTNKQKTNQTLSVVETGSKTKSKRKVLQVKKHYTWKQLEKIPYAEQQELASIFIKRAEGAEHIYSFCPWPVIPMKIKKVVRPVPLYFNRQFNHFEIATRETKVHAVSQRTSYHRSLQAKPELKDKYEQYIDDVYGGRGGTEIKYDDIVHPVRLKEIAKRTPFKDHWYKYLEIDKNTYNNWKEIYPRFRKVALKWEGKQIRRIEESIMKDMVDNKYQNEWTEQKKVKIDGRKQQVDVKMKGMSPKERAGVLAMLKSKRWKEQQKTNEFTGELKVINNPDGNDVDTSYIKEPINTGNMADRVFKNIKVD